MAGRRGLILFVVNGLVATAVHYATLTLLVEAAGVKPVGLANGLASAVGIAASYLGNRFLVFQSTAASTRTLPRFLLLYGAIAAFHAGFLTVWTDLAGFRYGLGFLLATAAATAISYLGNRYLVFAAPSAQA